MRKSATPAPSDPEALLRDRVRALPAELPPQQRAVVDFLLEHVRELGVIGAPEIAQTCATSEATVVRVAQRLGYDGFRGLRKSFEASLREGMTPSLPPAAEALARSPDSDPLTVVAAMEIQNVHRGIEEIDRRALTQLADALFAADHVYTYGLGISAHLAEILVYLLAQIGVRATTISTRFATPLEMLASVRRGDLVIALSFPPYSRATLKLLAEARGRNIKTGVITDKLTAPAAKHASLVVPVRSENMMFTNAFAGISVVMNALVTEAALRHRERAGAAVARITAAYQDHER